ncbi:hypothetical protein [Hydrocarboniphaga effusa]|uniref:Uncharacterized protein n=1 Tax=Hydrocarboniphaga effusa AP103 TaxID=1172194 RepID=I8TCJ6_9GAMM|nr:hypothetical protein [Hydrocarboniphaga effusa]EIT71665.1 hypothetical protein WQQ_18020 [Hydrocarboniphaga effusa AP103]
MNKAAWIWKCAAVFAGLLGWLPAQAGSAADIPLAVFAAHPDFVEVRLSPTGDYVAAVMRDDERSQLVVLRTATMEASLRLQLPVKQHVDDIWWASPKRLVLSGAVQADGWAAPRRKAICSPSITTARTRATSPAIATDRSIAPSAG